MANQKKTDLRDLRNVEVKALRDHSNSYGSKFEKKKGDTYIHPLPEADIAAGIVELVPVK